MFSWIDEIHQWRQELEEAPAAKVDIQSVVDYAEDKHKDDVATPKKKWKFL